MTLKVVKDAEKFIKEFIEAGEFCGKDCPTCAWNKKAVSIIKRLLKFVP